MPASQAGRRRFDPGRPLHRFSHAERDFSTGYHPSAVWPEKLVTVLVTVPKQLCEPPATARRATSAQDQSRRWLEGPLARTSPPATLASRVAASLSGTAPGATTRTR